MKSTPRNLMAGITSHPTKSADKEGETNQSSRGRESRQREPIRVLGYFPFEAAGNRDILSRKRRGSDVSTVKNPEEKKRLSLARDRRNRYGEKSKASRKSIQRGKQRRHMDERRTAGHELGRLQGRVQQDEEPEEKLPAKTKNTASQTPGRHTPRA